MKYQTQKYTKGYKMTYTEFFEKILPLLLNHTVDRIDKILDDGSCVKAYWVGVVLRIDIIPA